MTERLAPPIRLATEYGHIIGAAASHAVVRPQPLVLDPAPDYIAFEAAHKNEEPVSALDILIWDGVQDYTIWLVPYAELKTSQIKREHIILNSREHVITIKGRNLDSWAFRDSLKKYRIKSIQEWNPAVHQPTRAGQPCITRISLEAQES